MKYQQIKFNSTRKGHSVTKWVSSLNARLVHIHKSMWCKHARPLWGTAWQFLKQVSGYPGCTSKRVKSRDLKRRPYARNRSSIHDQKATPPDAQRQVKERRAPPGGKQGSADTLTADAWAPRSGRQQTPAALRRRCVPTLLRSPRTLARLPGPHWDPNSGLPFELQSIAPSLRGPFQQTSDPVG